MFAGFQVSASAWGQAGHTATPSYGYLLVAVLLLLALLAAILAVVAVTERARTMRRTADLDNSNEDFADEGRRGDEVCCMHE